MTRKQAMPLKDLGDDAAAMLMLWWKAPKKCLLKVPTSNRFFQVDADVKSFAHALC